MVSLRSICVLLTLSALLLAPDAAAAGEKKTEVAAPEKKAEAAAPEKKAEAAAPEKKTEAAAPPAGEKKTEVAIGKMFPMSNSQFQLVYNILSFSLASMMATTLFLWMRVPSIGAKYQTALIISGLVTFIAAYHYMRIFNSWTEAYHYMPSTDGKDKDPQTTGIPFNDAYRYMDWLLTVPMLLMEIVLVMKLSSDEASQKCVTLGVSAALMIILGYPGELIVEGDLWVRWVWWAAAMLPFCYIVQQLLVGLAEATSSETNEQVRALVFRAQWVTVVSWLTYPVVYVFPMIGFSGAQAVVAIQVGYCASDVISKCGVGLIIYSITAAKSQLEKEGALLP